jgi:hypothetical protein
MGCPSGKDGSQCECLTKRDSSVPRSDGGLFGDGVNLSGDQESIAVHEEVHKEEALVKTLRALKERYGDWHVAVGCRRQLKKWTKGSSGSQKKSAAALRGMARHAILALCMRHSHQGPGRDSVARGAAKGLMLERRQQMRQEGSSGIRE